MNKNILFTALGESPALRRWMAEQLHSRFDYFMLTSIIEEMLDKSDTYRSWALDQFNGELLIDHDYTDDVDQMIGVIRELVADNNKIKAIKYLIEESRGKELLRESIINRFPYLTIEFLNSVEDVDGDPIVNDTGALTIRYAKVFVEHVQPNTSPMLEAWEAGRKFYS